jgi:small conductance mechanosensitive channel
MARLISGRTTTVTVDVDQFQNIYEIATEFLVTYSFQVLGAIVILIAGVIVGRWVGNLVVKAGERRDLDVTLRMFLGSIARLVVLTMFVIVALGNFGITMTPLIAALGALAFGASLAIQGPVSNYGAGLAIILGRPFTVGNTITLGDTSGVVEEVKLATTVLSTEDGEKITIPNKMIVGEILTNSFENKVVEGVIGIDYTSDVEAAIAIIHRALASLEGVTQEPAPQIGVQGFGESSIDLGMRYWVPTCRYFQTQYAVNLKVFQALLDGGVTIPYPRREVQLLGQGAAFAS